MSPPAGGATSTGGSGPLTSPLKSTGVSSSDISVILEQNPVLCDVVGVDGVVIVTALPLAPSLYTSDIIAIACALTGMVCDLDDLALYQRLVDPERPAVSGVYTVGSVLLPADLYLPSDARPGLTLLQRELDVEPSECVAPVRAHVCLVFFSFTVRGRTWCPFLV